MVSRSCTLASFSENVDTSLGLTDYFTAQGKIDSKRKKDLLTARYSDAKPQSRLGQQKDGEFTTDLEHFEMEQTAKAQLRAGALDRPVVEEEEYDFVFDESVQIQFAMDNEDRIEGTMSGKDAALQAQILEAEKRGKLRSLCYLSDRPVLICDWICSSINR